MDSSKKRHGEAPSPYDTVPKYINDMLTEEQDPYLYNVYADMHQWMKDHPCNCDAVCTCPWMNE